MANRRESLKIIGAIGATCAFPFPADELYGQHVHSPAAAQTGQQSTKLVTDAQLQDPNFQDNQFVRRIAGGLIPGHSR